MKKIILFLGLVLILLSSCSKNENIEKDKINYYEDAKYLTEKLEDSHPYFIVNKDLKEYEKSKKNFLKESKKIENIEDFKLSIQKYETVFKDAHLSLKTQDYTNAVVDKWEYKDNGLYLLGGKGNIANSKVIEIADIPVEKIFKTIDKYYTYENGTAREFNYSLYSGEVSILKLSGANVKNNVVKVKTSDSEIEYTAKGVQWITKIITTESYTAKTEMIDDILYVDLKHFEVDDKLNEAVHFVKDKIDSGVIKVIIDIRDNGGGNSKAGILLLEAMGSGVPVYGGLARTSELTLDGDEKEKISQEYYEMEGDIKVEPKNDDLELVVLMNKKSFSSSTMFGAWVQDGKIGKIIGQPSRNAPSLYGDISIIKLPNSKINIPISVKYFKRPDKNANQDTLEPDILVPENEDSLKVAIEYLNK